MNGKEMTSSNSEIKKKLAALYDELFRHEGYGRIEVDMKILRRGQKEVVLRCGKEYRFVVDFPEKPEQAGKVTSLASKTAGKNRI
ncbi:MAG: hypothetical protein KAR13_01200 [Desulfobulbaceae bacterium]|nr:hypothetical protein [Desulfobulbaceae bacterium]